MAADVVRYVNTSSSGGDGKTNAESGGSAAYSSMFAWEAAEDTANLVGAETIHRVYCDSGTGDTPDTTAVTLASWTVNSTYYIVVSANSNGQGGKDNRSGATWVDTKYYIQNTGAGPQTINQNVNFTVIDHLQINAVGTNSFAGGKAMYCNSGGGPTYLNNSLVRYQCNLPDNPNSGNYGYAVWAQALMEANNTVAYVEQIGAKAPYNAIAFYMPWGNSDDRAINCTGVACDSLNISMGFWNNGNGDPDPIVVNCLGYGSGSTIGGGFRATGWDSSKCSNNASNGTYAPGNGAVTGAVFSFESFAGFDFRITSDDTGAQSLGTDMSSDSTSGSYLSSDYLGVTRTDPWDIGAFQVDAGGGNGGGAGGGTLTDVISVGIFGVSAITVGPINTYA